MAHFEEQLTSDVIYDGRVVHLTRDEVRLENGAVGIREIVHHNGGACVVAVTEDKQVYVVRQYRYATGCEMWELPAGKLEKGEDPFEAAKRELTEEVGVTADNWRDLGYFWPTVGYCTERIHMYLATGLHPVEAHPDADEFLEAERMPLEEAVALALAGGLPDAKTQTAILKTWLLRAAKSE